MLQVPTEAVSTFCNDIKDDTVECFHEVVTECTPTVSKAQSLEFLKDTAISFIHIPYFPAFHSPGWLLRYIVGPYDSWWLESLLSDALAGLTVGLTLIPQGLSFGALANLPQVNGLYAALLPGATYTFFGSSMQLAVGPTALVSMLTGTLVNKYNADPGSLEAISVGTQAALTVGMILTVCSFLNLGSLVSYVAHPVMSGFVTGACLVIGLNQIRSAFNFPKFAPQSGQEGYEYNYQIMQWIIDNWHGHYPLKEKKNSGQPYINEVAVKIALGLYFPLIIVKLLQKRISSKCSKETKKTLPYKIFDFFCNFCPFLGIILAAHMTWKMKTDEDLYKSDWNVRTLKIVGQVPEGLNFLRSPKFDYSFAGFFVDCLPLTFVAYMESYGIAQRIASERNELHLLNASQEMWANGIANLMSSVSSAFPVCGSFSRSSLNAASGARTPFSKVTTLITIIIALTTLAESFYYIPNAALAAIIWVAIYPLLAFDEIWEAWKYSKKDFLLMIVTLVLQFVFETQVGLAVGLSLSIVIYVWEANFTNHTQAQLEKHASENNGIDIVAFKSCNFTFLNAPSIKSFLVNLTFTPIEHPNDLNFQQRTFNLVTETMDRTFRPFEKAPTVFTKPKAIILDMGLVKVIDLTAMMLMNELLLDAKVRKVSLIFVNIAPHILIKLKKFGSRNYVVAASAYDEDILVYVRRSELETHVEPGGGGAGEGEGQASVEGGQTHHQHSLVSNKDDDETIELKMNDELVVGDIEMQNTNHHDKNKEGNHLQDESNSEEDLETAYVVDDKSIKTMAQTSWSRRL